MYSKLLIARKERRITQAQVAKVLFISEGCYQRKENKKVDFTLNEAILLSKFFNKSLDDLFGE